MNIEDIQIPENAQKIINVAIAKGIGFRVIVAAHVTLSDDRFPTWEEALVFAIEKQRTLSVQIPVNIVCDDRGGRDILGLENGKDGAVVYKWC